MLFYSTELKKSFETPEDCLKAEKAFKDQQAKKKAEEEAKAATRKERSDKLAALEKEVAASEQKVVDARKEFIEMSKKYHTELEKFCKDFGQYYVTKTSKSISDDFDRLLSWILF